MSEAESASPPPRRGRNCSSEGSRRRGDLLAAGAALALLAEHVLVERRGLDRRPLLGRRDPAEELVDRRHRLRRRLGAGALDQRRELDQLEIASDRAS